MANWNDLPTEIWLQILQNLVADHNHNDTQPRRLASYVATCRWWQEFFEEHIFRQLILFRENINAFDLIVTPARQKLVKHILLLVEVRHNDQIDWINGKKELWSSQCDSRTFKNTVHHLFSVLSKWNKGDVNGGLTFELGAYSSYEKDRLVDPFHEKIERYSKFLRTRLPMAFQTCQDLVHHFVRRPKTLYGRYEWVYDKRRLFGMEAIDFCCRQFGQHHSLPKVQVVDQFLVRLQNYRNFNPRALLQILVSLPRIYDLRLERWPCGCYVNDLRWKAGFGSFVSEISIPMRRLSLYEESNNYFYRSYSSKDPTLADRIISQGLFRASFGLEELALSFIVDAKDFLEHFGPGSYNPLDVPPGSRVFNGTRWERLRAVTLTSSLLTSGRQDETTELLLQAATAARMMPKLEIMEIYDQRNGAAAVFRYRHTQRRSIIVWYGTWILDISSRLRHSWEEVASYHSKERHMLEIIVRPFPEERAGKIGGVLGYLDTWDNVLDGSSISTVMSLN